MTAVNISPRIKPITQASRYCRNGKAPDAALQAELADLTNSCAGIRGKDLWRMAGDISKIVEPGDSTQTIRGRFAFHTGPFTQSVVAQLVMAKLFGFDLSTIADGYAELRVTDTSGTLIGSQAIHWSPIGDGNGDVPDNFASGKARVAVSPDTNYYGYVASWNHGRLVSANAYEELLAPNTTNGFASGVSGSVGGPIYDTHRASLVAMAQSMWRRAGGLNWHWNIDNDATNLRTTTTSDKNIVDNTSTTVSAATPGFTLDLTGKTTVALASTGVPCVIAVYGGRVGGTAGQQGVKIKDSSGTTIVNLTGAPTTGNWFATTFNLPATKAKYDVQYYATSGTFLVEAVSIYELA